LEYLARFLIGGIVVSLFAILGDILRPKSFAGLFGAAPSVALATLSLTVSQKGSHYAAVESHGMILGAIALMIYSVLVCHLLMRRNRSALGATTISIVVWLVIAVGLHLVFGANA
jgi:hypothetical protein